MREVRAPSISDRSRRLAEERRATEEHQGGGIASQNWSRMATTPRHQQLAKEAKERRARSASRERDSFRSASATRSRSRSSSRTRAPSPNVLVPRPQTANRHSREAARQTHSRSRSGRGGFGSGSPRGLTTPRSGSATRGRDRRPRSSRGQRRRSSSRDSASSRASSNSALRCLSLLLLRRSEPDAAWEQAVCAARARWARDHSCTRRCRMRGVSWWCGRGSCARLSRRPRPSGASGSSRLPRCVGSSHFDPPL